MASQIDQKPLMIYSHRGKATLSDIVTNCVNAVLEAEAKAVEKMLAGWSLGLRSGGAQVKVFEIQSITTLTSYNCWLYLELIVNPKLGGMSMSPPIWPNQGFARLNPTLPL